MTDPTPRDPVRDLSTNEAMLDDMTALMEVLGISTHARRVSPHRVMVDEVIPAALALAARVAAADESRAALLEALYDAVGAAPASRETPRQRAVLAAWQAIAARDALRTLAHPPSVAGEAG